MTPDRDPIIVADAGPLVRLAAAGLLDTLRGLNRQIVLLDRVEDEVTGDLSKPFAREVAAWVAAMGPAIRRERSLVGVAIEALRAKPRTPAEDQLLKRTLRDSGERAIREFLESWQPADVQAALVVYEDSGTVPLMEAARVPMTLMTTRRFARQIREWGVNLGAEQALEAIADSFSLKPAFYTELEPAPGP